MRARGLLIVGSVAALFVAGATQVGRVTPARSDGGERGERAAGAGAAYLHASDRQPPPRMVTAGRCVACHNGLVAPSGEDVSIGADWRASIMANAARDPYWQAAVRREIMDHPGAESEIQADCTRCHMPMLNVHQTARGRRPQVLPHLPIVEAEDTLDRLAADGVSCALCHQITEERLGTEASFTGGYVVDTMRWDGHGRAYGPFGVDSGRATIMRSATTLDPTEAAHVRSSELCATCHTLFRDTYGPDDEVIGQIAEQMPYLEWLNSDYRSVRSCQDCHMAAVEDSTAITSVLGQPRPELSRHWFVGGNFFILRMLNRYRHELGVEALPQELDDAVDRTEAFLRTQTAGVVVERVEVSDDGRLEAEVVVENLTGHKLPTAYPSRRAWLHVRVLDGRGGVIFESGALRPDGSIVGNANDTHPDRYERHHDAIESPEQVQVYEAIMVSPDDEVTTGLTTGIRHVKDNRLVPHGFDKAGASEEIAVHGRAVRDRDFADGRDRVRYRVDVARATGPFSVEAALWYQPISFRWADNLRAYDAYETNRFATWFDAMSEVSALMLARDSVRSR